MIASMDGYSQESLFSRWWKSRTFIQKRLIRLCLSMLVFVLCMPLYYLGFFGTVEGPLNPARIGESLAAMGVAKTHSILFFLTLMIITVTWNWIFNLVSYLAGARLTCNKTDDDGKPCGAPVEKRRVIHKKTGLTVPQYVCAQGHKRPEAHFHPVQKGTISHTLWVVALVFCVIVIFLS